MIKFVSFAATLLFGTTLLCGTASAQDSSPHHTAMHAEHWVDHHVSAPHKRVVRHRKPKRHDRSTHHAAMHAERWIDHHVSAPHKNNGH
jgi:hypothetical protein